MKSHFLITWYLLNNAFKFYSILKATDNQEAINSNQVLIQQSIYYLNSKYFAEQGCFDESQLNGWWLIRIGEGLITLRSHTEFSFS